MYTPYTSSILQARIAVLVRRQDHSAINDHADIQAIFAAALLLKNATVKEQVMRVLLGGLDNADDSAYDSYDKHRQADYPNRSEYWAAMFYGTCQSLTCERDYVNNGHARHWLFARGLMG